ncbi:hypothetical protein PM082_015670 [Marasmius tenuissimus]|nr:hypothetical protein PM082_015670 [Marasmius tenuissimus]
MSSTTTNARPKATYTRAAQPRTQQAQLTTPASSVARPVAQVPQHSPVTEPIPKPTVCLRKPSGRHSCSRSRVHDWRSQPCCRTPQARGKVFHALR